MAAPSVRPVSPAYPALSGADAAYLARVRGALARLGARADGDDQGLGAALADLEDAAAIDVEVPVASARREVELAKRGARKLVRWYLRYLAEQVTALGQATTRLGVALAGRVDRLDDTTAGLVAEVAGLRDRLERLEGRAAGEREDR